MKKYIPLIILVFVNLLIFTACSEDAVFTGISEIPPTAHIDNTGNQDTEPESSVQKYSREYWGEWKKMDQSESWEITSTWIKVNGKYLSRDVVLAKPSENVISVTDGKITYCLYAVRTASSLISGSVESDDGSRGVGGWLPVVVQNINDRFDVTETTTDGDGVFSADKLIPGDDYRITIGDTSLTVTPSFDGEDIGNITLRDGVNFKVTLSNSNDIMFAGSDYYSMNLIIENIGDANCTAATYSLTADEGLEFINSYSEGVLLRTVAAGEKKTIPLKVRCDVPESETAIRKLHLTITDRNGMTWNDSVSLKFYKNTITINVVSENDRPISGVIIGEGRTYSITNKTNYSIEVPVSPESYLMVFSGAIANASRNTEAAYSIGLDCPAIESGLLLTELGADVNNFEPNDDEDHAHTLLLEKAMVAYLFENDIDYYILEPFHEWDDGVITKEATCTEEGIKVYTCQICQQTKTESIPSTGHSFSSEWSDDAYYHWHVSTCGHDAISEKAIHTWGNGKVITHATHTTYGVQQYECTVCGRTREQIITALEDAHSFSEEWTSNADYHWHESTCGHDVVGGKALHVWDNGVVIIAATHTTDGLMEYECTVCGATKEEIIPALVDDHSFSDEWTSDADYHWHVSTCGHDVISGKATHVGTGGIITVQPTCTESGERELTCSECGRSFVEIIPASGHRWDEGVVTKAATCTEAGTLTYTCDACSATRTETIPATGHTSDSGIITKEATCTAAGVKSFSCTTCGVVVRTESLPATGHSFSYGWTNDSNYHWHAATCGHSAVKDKASHTWVYISGTSATCTASGSATYKCSVCGATKTETIAVTGHKWNSGVVVTSPTCTTTGTKVYTCTTCSATKSETIAALGHSFSTAWTNDSDYHWHISTCGHDVISGKASHSWNSGTVTIEPTTTKEGLKTYTCTVCGRTRTEVLPKKEIVYSIGDTGPAGGYVFYDKGYYSDGWRYLEAAPSDLSGTYMWGDNSTAGGGLVYATSTGIGSGKRNTNDISSYLSSNRPGNAAKACLSYSKNGFSDWFLPSKDELNLMYYNLHKKGIGAFSSDIYWSSSGFYDSTITYYALGQSFSSGTQSSSYFRESKYKVRPIRAF